MSLVNQNIIAGAAGQQGYQISRSVRLRRSASAYLNRTPAGAGNQKTWTWSGWVKRGALATTYTYQYILGSYSGSSANETALNFGSNNELTFFSYASAYTINCSTSAVFRDPSAWYHIVLAVDTTQATNSNGVKLYVNGVQQTLTFSAYTQNTNTWVNGANVQLLSNNANLNSQLDGYLTETVMVDGQALTPSSFGEYNAITGVWQPKKYTGTYGTNGFYLNFSDNSAATAAAIGKDSSGNGNNWTPNNISVTAGATYDSMIDTPTPYIDGGNGRGNYPTLNPLEKWGTTPTNYGSTSNGNLTCTESAGAGTAQYFTTMPMPTSGKWYWEITCDVLMPTYSYYPICSMFPVGYEFTSSLGMGGYSTPGVAIYSSGNYYYNSGSTGSTTAVTAGQTRCFAYDASTGKFWHRINGGSWIGGGDPAAGTTPFVTVDSTQNYYQAVGNSQSTSTSNFGQRPFAYTPPTGFNALNTQNLPTPTITNGAKYMAATTYTGNGATGQTISNGANTTTGTTFQPDLVWVKSRSNAYDNGLQDSVRGVTKDLNSNNTDAEETRASSITAFASNGFTLGGNDLVYNGSGSTYVGWQWKANGSAVSNTAGSITSQVNANPTAGFSVVTYTGTGANATVGHGLGVAPKMIILKQRNAIDYWVAWQTTLGSTGYLLLNSTNASSTAATYWNSTLPTSTVFSLGSDSRPNGNGTTYVAYCWSEVAGYSRFGSYTGNGSTDGVFVYTGMRPRYVMVKASSAVEGWVVWDSARDTYNAMPDVLYPNGSNAEVGGTQIDFLSNGFKLRNSATNGNISGVTYIYAAFAENPFKNSLAR